MNNRKQLFFPPRWLKCPPVGDVLLDLFIPCKTPLDHKYTDFITDEDDIFNPDCLFEAVKPYQLGMIVDLTKSNRFYKRDEIENHGCKYVKIACKGNEECPTAEQVTLFIGVVNQFKKMNKDNDKKIAVHCTHGYNRTGFMIVSYLVEECQCSLEYALQLFAEARKPGIYKADYLKQLYTRFDDPEDCPLPPELPDWCNEEESGGEALGLRKRRHPDSPVDDDVGADEENEESCLSKVPRFPFTPPGQPKLMEGVTGVETLDQSSLEAHKVRTVVDYLIRFGSVLPHRDEVSATTSDSAPLQQPFETLDPPVSSLSKDIHHCPLDLDLNLDLKMRFKGSQPVSMTRQNVALIADNPYMASYKSDGTRYLMLILGPGRVFLIDRGNFVYKVGCLEFPSYLWVSGALEEIGKGTRPSDFNTATDGHLVNTLVDGELVKFDNTPDRPFKFLIFDAIVILGQPIGRAPFEKRWEWIEKYVVFPRNMAGHKNLVDFGKQTFSVRRKPFFPINKVDDLIKLTRQDLEHETDGLIFQPCGPHDYYVLGTCKKTLKWKPPELNTIDFLCRIRYHTAIGEVSHHVGDLFLGGDYKVPAAKLSRVTSKEMAYDGKIVECAVDSTVPGGGWKVLRVRTDKTEPNHQSVGLRIMDSIKYPVNAPDVLRYVNARLLYLQQRKREEEERARRMAERNSSTAP
nr:mrna capping enzyme [Hymenolepis microstoma]